MNSRGIGNLNATGFSGRSLLAASLLVPILLVWWMASGRRAQGQESTEKYHQGPGTKRMAAILARLADEADANPQINPFWNHKRAEAIRSLLARPDIPADQALELRISLARELLWAGKTEEAITEFTAIEKRIAGPGTKASQSVLADIHYWIALSYLRLGEQETISNHVCCRSGLPVFTPCNADLVLQRRGSRPSSRPTRTILPLDGY